jgi:putative IMPACT (imprinted ancient) family translation regulator
MLAVLRGADLGDVTVVVSRRFGGTLLGTGGLVRAYGDAVRAVLEQLPRAEQVELVRVSVLVSYAGYAAARRALEAAGASIAGEEFAADVRLAVVVPADQHAAALAALESATAGQAIVEG